jgi:hypothetical protein
LLKSQDQLLQLQLSACLNSVTEEVVQEKVAVAALIVDPLEVAQETSVVVQTAVVLVVEQDPADVQQESLLVSLQEDLLEIAKA